MIRLKEIINAVKGNSNITFKSKIRVFLKYSISDLNTYLEDVVEYNAVMRRKKAYNKIQELIAKI